MNLIETQVPQSNEPSTLAVENAQVVDNAGLLVQQVINEGKDKDFKLVYSVYNRQLNGESCIWPRVGNYQDFRVSVNNLQLEKLKDQALTGNKVQVFPLADEDVAKAKDDDLLPVENIREKLLTAFINAGAYKYIKVLPFKGDVDHIVVHANMPGALVTFWIDKKSEVADFMRKKHMIM